jgi:hypothetical protein
MASLPVALLLAAALPLEVIGFSPDGGYVAFVEHGVGEGSGYPWARLRVLEVARNAEALPPAEVRLESTEAPDTEEEAVRRARAAAREALGKLKIASWVDARAVRHDPDGELADREGAPIGTLQIQQRVGKEGKTRCDQPFRPLLLRLVLFFLDDDRPARLAADPALPASRPCASECALAGMFAHRKSALAVVRCTVPGFEGPSAKYSAYAGVLPWPLDEPLPAK